MKFSGLFLLLVCFLSFFQLQSQVKEPVDYADPLLGTSESRWMLNPGATMPFGMVQLSPDNQGGVWKSGYEYSLNNVGGFSHIHSWTMAGLSVMPTVGVLNTRRGPADGPTTGWTTGYRSRIYKESENASPGYYSVKLMNGNIRTELTSTTRAGFFRFKFPEEEDVHILFDLDIPFENTAEILDATITHVNDKEIEGYSKQRSGWNEYTVHFVARFNKKIKSFGGWIGNDIKKEVKEIKGKGSMGAYADFTSSKGEIILMQTAISLVSIDQARLNLTTEMDPFNWSFDKVRQNARNVWNNLLSKIKVEGGSEINKKKFYTNYYRSYVARTTWSDVNGKYVDVNEVIRQVSPDEPVYGCDALWNTFWNLNQLWSIANPDLTSKWVKSFLEIYRTGGWLPKGPAGIEYSGIMEASHEIALIAGAYQKGIRDFDTALAMEAMIHQQTTPGIVTKEDGFAGNKFFESYMKLGYVPHEEGQVSNTLEYAYDDWCVAQYAKALGREDVYQQFMKRAGNYKNVFDTSVKYIRTKHKDGSWVKDWSPYCCTSFTGSGYLEGNAWQYSFFNPHDVQGILNLMGRDEFNQRLNEGFEKSARYSFNAEGDLYDLVPINHGNQPNMQAAWLFNYSGKPWLTQKWTKEIMNKYYGTTPYHGWLGDEDEGQMGAWFVMASMGLFQTNGGASVRPFYEIGSPLFEKTTIQLDPAYYKGKSFTIIAKGVSDKNIYIQSAQLDGKPLNKPWFFHDELTDGGTLVLQMGPKPNTSWGSAAGAEPPSMSGRNEIKKETDTPLVQRIKNDQYFHFVKDKALEIMKTGFNAGDGYREVWIRDYNTFIELAAAVYPKEVLKENLLVFFRMQGDDGNIIDGFTPAEKIGKGETDFSYSKLEPRYAGHKNTVETDQESSLVQAVYKYIQLTGDKTILKERIGDKTVMERLFWAMEFLMKHRFNEKYGLIIGATTADWGDVQPEHGWGVDLDNNTHPAIDIYDNAMMIVALNNLMDIDPSAKKKWSKIKDGIARNARKHLWDDKQQKFIPHIYLKGSPFPADFNENDIYYFGGTTVAIEAGLLNTQEIKASLEEMKKRVKQAGAASIGLTLYPPYPEGYFANKIMNPVYSYQNGGDWTWFGARMIQQLIKYGFTEDAYEQIQPMVKRVKDNNGFYEWYSIDNKPRGSGTFRGEAGVLYTAIRMFENIEK